MRIGSTPHIILAPLLVMAFFITGALSQEQSVISSFTTSLEGQDEGVRRNIALASRRLQGMVIAPGAVFSFNEAVGEGSARNGYADGRVLYLDGAANEPGGGICQVSSTIYNAFLRAGFEIVTRHRHLQPVAYVPPGLDATIKYGKKDLRVKNPWAFPVTVQVALSGDGLTIMLASAGRLPFQFAPETDEEEVRLPLKAAEGEVRNGISVYVYLMKYREGRLVEKRLLYKDYYPPVYFK